MLVMKRVILCVICLICLTGCEVSYDLTLTEESINEVTKVYTDISLNEMYGDDLLINFLNNSVNTYEPIYFNDENYDYYESGYQKNVRFYNINNKVFITDVKAFSIAMLCGAIAIFEYAYKKDSTKFAIYGIESLVMAILTMSLIYINLMYFDKFAYVVAIIAFALAAYYIVKCVVIYKINKKKYFMNQMREIIDKDEENE